MHEYSIVEAIIGRIEEEVRRQNATAVHRVEIRVGDLAGVERELLASAWETFKAGSCCANTALVIHGRAARWGCSGCDRRIEAGGDLQCPTCGGAARLVEGAELLLERIELEVA
ncbi:hydrogenase maturation nickel metallochaperone HypA [Vulgatibacter sp.]|uniref:hydrogenase maturation nickel metallochaperone HypA/HybF n=1 Tax=Vulgatibacter sp. TaxID=1971226 RepID=UPI0035633D40